MHHFVVKFSNFSSPQAGRGIDPLTKILRTFLHNHINFRNNDGQTDGPTDVSVTPMLSAMDAVGITTSKQTNLVEYITATKNVIADCN